MLAQVSKLQDKVGCGEASAWFRSATVRNIAGALTTLARRPLIKHYYILPRRHPRPPNTLRNHQFTLIPTFPRRLRPYPFLATQNGEPNSRRCHGQVSTYCPPRYPHVLTDTSHSGTGYSKLGFAGNDSPSFVFPTAIATKGPTGGAGGSGSGRPAVANKPTFLTGGAGGGHLSGKRGTEDLDFFIGDEALAAASGPGMFERGYMYKGLHDL